MTRSVVFASNTVFVALVLLAVSACAQGPGKISLKTKEVSVGYPVPESNAKPGESAAQVVEVTTSQNCTGTLYKTGIYASVDKSNLDNTWVNFVFTLVLKDCPAGNYKAGSLFLVGSGTAFSAPSSLPKSVVGGSGSFKDVSSGYWFRSDDKNKVFTVNWA